MKKALIYYYHSQNLKSITGLEHNSEIDYYKIFEIAQEVFNKGLNVMIVHTKVSDDNDILGILYIDDRNFKQR